MGPGSRSHTFHDYGEQRLEKIGLQIRSARSLIGEPTVRSSSLETISTGNCPLGKDGTPSGEVPRGRLFSGGSVTLGNDPTRQC